MNPLDQLKDVHLPEQIGWWPLAWGWWVLMAIVLTSLIAGILWYLHRRKQRLMQRLALAELAAIQVSTPNWPVALNTLLKRVALHYFPSERIASLHGDQWHQFLLQQLPKSKQEAFDKVGKPLQQALYRAPQNLDFDQVKTQIQVWLMSALPPKTDKIQEGSDV